MKKLLLTFAFGIIALLFAVNVSAQTLLQYPIPELGFCRDAKECYLYCEIPEYKAACWSYGEFRLGQQVLGETTLSPEERRAMEEKARELGITFPIAELSNCTGPQECRDFCENPANHTSCMNFARKHGFSEEAQEDSQVNEAEILAAARNELGCSSKESCHAICERDHERCIAFAKKHGLYRQETRDGGGEKERLMEEARNELGCTSMESCSRVCEQNPARCMEFAKRHGFDQEGQQQNTGPGGCSSEESCRRYCQEHPSECPGYQEHSEGQSPQESYAAPTGCRTEAECQAYCQSNPSACPGYTEAQTSQPPPPQYTPAQDQSSWCTSQPGCSWNGSSCNCTAPQSPPPTSETYQPPSTDYQQYQESPPAYAPPQEYQSSQPPH